MDAIYVYFTIVVASFISLVLNRHRLERNIFWYFFVLLLMVILAEGAGLLNWEIADAILHNFYCPIEITCLGLAYRAVLKDQRVRKVVPVLIILAWLLLAGQLITRGVGSTNELLIFYTHLTIVPLSLFYFYESFRPPFEQASIFRNSFFWINCGNLFFYAGTMVQSTLQDVLPEMTLAQDYIMYYISTVFNQSLYLLYLIGFSSTRLFK